MTKLKLYRTCDKILLDLLRKTNLNVMGFTAGMQIATEFNLHTHEVQACIDVIGGRCFIKREIEVSYKDKGVLHTMCTITDSGKAFITQNSFEREFWDERIKVILPVLSLLIAAGSLFHSFVNSEKNTKKRIEMRQELLDSNKKVNARIDRMGR